MFFHSLQIRKALHFVTYHPWS